MTGKCASDQPLSLELGGRSYPVRIRRSARAKAISLAADTVRGEVRIGLPARAPAREGLRFAELKRDWLAERFAAAPPPLPLVAGASFPLIGEPVRIDWRADRPRAVRRERGVLLLGGPEDRIAARITRWLKQEARREMLADLRHYCRRAGEPVPALSLGDARTRWGSCSAGGRVRLNWRLIMAPRFVRRSVVAHEVAHLAHMDHGREFYRWLDRIYEGDRAAADRWLRCEGRSLHMVGRQGTE